MVEQPPALVEPELLVGLGTVVSRWSYVDMFMAEFLSFLLQANPGFMYVVTANVSASTVSDWIRTLLQARHIPNEPPEEIMSLLVDIDRIRGERNALVHGLWRPHVTGSALVQTVRWNRSEIVKDEVVTRADLDDLITNIGEVMGKLLGLGERYGFPVPSYVSEFLATPEGLLLTKAFMRINEPKLRRRIALPAPRRRAAFPVRNGVARV